MSIFCYFGKIRCFVDGHTCRHELQLRIVSGTGFDFVYPVQNVRPQLGPLLHRLDEFHKISTMVNRLISLPVRCRYSGLLNISRRYYPSQLAHDPGQVSSCDLNIYSVAIVSHWEGHFVYGGSFW